MKTLNNLNLFYSLCKEYNLIINLQSQYVIHAIIPTNYTVDDFILEYNIKKIPYICLSIYKEIINISFCSLFLNLPLNFLS